LDIYKKQKEGISAEGRFLSNIILDYVESEVTQVVTFHTAVENVADWNLQEIYESVKTIYNLSEEDKNKILNITASGGNKDDFRNELLNYLKSLAQKNYQAMREGFSGLDINFIEIEKGILIRSIDNLWIEHLETIDYLRRGIGLRGYGQRDPLVEYKKEAYHMYQDLLGLIQRQVVYSIYKTGDVSNFIAPSIIERAKKYSAPLKEMARRSAGGPVENSTGTIDMVRDKVKNEEGDKVGRNDLCPCGSGKKYKRCHGA
jgi:preprotein translocase subunit SecA